MKYLSTIIIIILPTFSMAKTIINGKVTDSKGLPISVANVYLEGAYYGGTTTNLGEFIFKSEETGTQTLIISFLSYETFRMTGDIGTMTSLNIKPMARYFGLKPIIKIMNI